MAIGKSVANFAPGPGSGYIYQNVNVAINNQTSQTSTNVPSTGSMVPALASGRCRAKFYNGGGTSPTVTDFLVTATDGTNTVTIGTSILHPNAPVVLSATAWLDYTFEYLFDNIISGGNGGPSGNLITTGATSFAFKLTMGGTSPTCTADYEVYGEP